MCELRQLGAKGGPGKGRILIIWCKHWQPALPCPSGKIESTSCFYGKRELPGSPASSRSFHVKEIVIREAEVPGCTSPFYEKQEKPDSNGTWTRDRAFESHLSQVFLLSPVKGPATWLFSFPISISIFPISLPPRNALLNTNPLCMFKQCCYIQNVAEWI